jgi:hypothetical protein
MSFSSSFASSPLPSSLGGFSLPKETDPMSKLSKTAAISREKAIFEGIKLFDSPVPCRRGHTGKRYTANNTCVECMKESRLRAQGKKKEPDGSWVQDYRDPIAAVFANGPVPTWGPPEGYPGLAKYLKEPK